MILSFCRSRSVMQTTPMKPMCSTVQMLQMRTPGLLSSHGHTLTVDAQTNGVCLQLRLLVCLKSLSEANLTGLMFSDKPHLMIDYITWVCSVHSEMGKMNEDISMITRYWFKLSNPFYIFHSWFIPSAHTIQAHWVPNTYWNICDGNGFWPDRHKPVSKRRRKWRSESVCRHGEM